MATRKKIRLDWRGRLLVEYLGRSYSPVSVSPYNVGQRPIITSHDSLWLGVGDEKWIRRRVIHIIGTEIKCILRRIVDKQCASSIYSMLNDTFTNKIPSAETVSDLLEVDVSIMSAIQKGSELLVYSNWRSDSSTTMNFFPLDGLQKLHSYIGDMLAARSNI